MKRTSVVKLFLKTDHTGKRIPTALAIVVLILLVFGSYHFSRKNKSHAFEPKKQTIIKEREIFEVANQQLKISDQESMMNDIHQTILSQKQEIKFPKSDAIQLIKPEKHQYVPMIVYDQTDNYESDKIVPLGSMVKCLLIHNIVSNNFNSPVIAQVWEDFYFNDELLLPFGTRIYGTAFSGRQRDRVLVKFHSIVFQDGTTLSIDAIGLSQDGSGGLTGTVVDKRNKKAFTQMAANFLTGLSLGLQDTATNAITGLTEIENSTRNAVLEGVAQIFETEAKRIQEQIAQLDGYLVILAGSELKVYFEKPVDVSPL